MMKASQPTEALDEDELAELVTTNKCLAMEKRDFHRQKLRAYSEKSVKLRGILRETTDPEEKKCVEAKIKNLQKKQDLQITKLARIDQIEKELDEFITQENQDCFDQKSKKLSCYQKDLNQSASLQDTPAQRLRTKSSIPYKTRNDEEHQESAFSKPKGSFSKSKDNEELLLKDSRQALEEIVGNKLTIKSYNHSKNTLKEKSLLNQNLNYYGRYEPDKINPVKLQWCSEENTEPNIVYEGVPAVFSSFVEKVSKFWPNDLQSLVRYFKESEKIKQKYQEQQLRIKALNKREEKIRQEESRLRNSEQRVKKVEGSIQSLIQRQRCLMENIDKLQREEIAIEKQIQTSLSALANASKHISSSSCVLFQQNEPVKVDCFLSESIHKFSVDSFESFREGSAVTAELAKFQRGIQQYLMSAERTVMLVSGELQQVQAKLSKAKEETTHLQSRKKVLQTQIIKLDHGLNKKKKFLKQLQGQINRFQQEAAESGATVQIKKSLAQQFEEKCEKMRLKKKSLGEKVKNLEEEVQSFTLRKEELFEAVLQLEQQVVALKTYQKQLETKIIFCERDKQNRQKDIQMLQNKGEEIIKRVQESNVVSQQTIAKITQRQAQLAQINETINTKMEEEATLAERARKLQLQLSESTSILEQQIKLVHEQSERFAQKSAENLQIQSKISQALSNLRQTEVLIEQNDKKIIEQRNELEAGREELSEMLLAKADLESILHQVLVKKEQLIIEVQERSKQLQLLIGDLESGQADFQALHQKIKQLQTKIQDNQAEIKAQEEQSRDLRIELDEQLQEESNLLGRLGRLKQVQTKMLLGLGIKGGSSYLDEDLKGRVAEAVGELAALHDLKAQIKDCKYQNRKLKLQNQRLAKLLQGE